MILDGLPVALASQEEEAGLLLLSRSALSRWEQQFPAGFDPTRDELIVITVLLVVFVLLVAISVARTLRRWRERSRAQAAATASMSPSRRPSTPPLFPAGAGTQDALSLGLSRATDALDVLDVLGAVAAAEAADLAASLEDGPSMPPWLAPEPEPEPEPEPVAFTPIFPTSARVSDPVSRATAPSERLPERRRGATRVSAGAGSDMQVALMALVGAAAVLLVRRRRRRNQA